MQQFSPQELQVIEFTLRDAAKSYDEIARDFFESEIHRNIRLGEQFRKQANDARSIADKIEINEWR